LAAGRIPTDGLEARHRMEEGEGRRGMGAFEVGV